MSDLWICPRCELIGSEDDANKHRTETGHPAFVVDEDSASAVRRLWAEEGKDEWGRVSCSPSAADFMALARFKRLAEVNEHGSG